MCFKAYVSQLLGSIDTTAESRKQCTWVNSSTALKLGDGSKKHNSSCANSLHVHLSHWSQHQQSYCNNDRLSKIFLHDPDCMTWMVLIYKIHKGTIYSKYIHQALPKKVIALQMFTHILVKHSKPPCLVLFKSENTQQNIHSNLLLLSFVNGFSVTWFPSVQPSLEC